MKIEHAAAYLPYGLKCEILNYQNDYVGEKYGTMKGFYMLGDIPHYMFGDRSVAGKDSSLFKPILRPLSDLTKEITENGKTFVPMFHISQEYKYALEDPAFEYQHSVYKEVKEELLSGIICQKHFNSVLSWHFDIFGLIDKNEAIDVNTLEKNPYE